MTDDINVRSQTHIQTFHQVIAPGPRDRLLGLIETLLELVRGQRTNGKIVLNITQGGVRTVEVISTEQVQPK